MKLLEETIQDFYQNCDEDNQSEYATPRILSSLVMAHRPSVVVEIGSHMGFSSMAIASTLKFNAEHEPSEYLKKWKTEWHDVQNIKKVKGHLYCIDPMLQPHFERRLKKFELENYITFIQKKSDLVNVDSIPPVDFLFIDGNHSYEAALTDFQNFFPKVTPGGYIAIHDYFPNSPSEKMLWWGPNILTKQLREAMGFSDCLVIDTSFSGIALFRKKVAHIDYDFYSTNLAKTFIQFYIRKYKIKLNRIINKTKNIISN